MLNINAQTEVELECVNTTTSGTYLQWSAHDCPGVFGGYVVYHAIDPALTFFEIANTNNTDVIINDHTVPADPHYYYVTYICDGVEVPAGTNTISNQGLPLPDINKVTVASGSVNIEWEPINSSNVGGYVIAIPNGANTLAIDTIFDPNAGIYQDFFADPDSGPLSYTVFAIDKCEDFEISGSVFHTTVYLEQGVGSCDSSVPINWTHYEGWDSILEYRVFINGTQVAVVPSNENLYNIPVTTTAQTVIVEAVNPDGVTTSQSNAIIIDGAAPTLPTHLRLFSTTVPGGDLVYLTFEYNTFTPDVSFNLLRGTVDENNLEEGIFLDVEMNKVRFDGSDPDANPNSFSYFYRIQAKDGCGAVFQSNYSRTVLLNATDNFNKTITLDWNEYELEGQGVSINHYDLLRYDTNDYSNPTLVATFFPGETMSYTDDVSDVVSVRDDGYEYQIRVNYDVQTLTEGSLSGESSYSNRRIVIKNSRIVDVPTAFKPNGVNNEFKPKIDFPNAEEYSMVIINRWGEKIFESNDPEIGWSGLADDVLAPQGVYAYVIKMKSHNSRDLIRKGTVMLIR